MAKLDDYNILQLRHLVRSRLSRVHDSASIQNLNISQLRMLKCQTMCRMTNEYLAQLDLRETEYQEGLGTLVTWVDQVFEYLIR
jgi:hypothetical protein